MTVFLTIDMTCGYSALTPAPFRLDGISVILSSSCCEYSAWRLSLKFSPSSAPALRLHPAYLKSFRTSSLFRVRAQMPEGLIQNQAHPANAPIALALLVGAAFYGSPSRVGYIAPGKTSSQGFPPHCLRQASAPAGASASLVMLLRTFQSLQRKVRRFSRLLFAYGAPTFRAFAHPRKIQTPSIAILGIARHIAASPGDASSSLTEVGPWLVRLAATWRSFFLVERNLRSPRPPSSHPLAALLCS